MLIGVHERAVFPGLEELFTAANGYLVNHSSNGIFDVTIVFLTLTLKMCILVYYMPYFRHFGSIVRSQIVRKSDSLPVLVLGLGLG